MHVGLNDGGVIRTVPATNTLWSWTAVLGDPVLYLAKGTPNEAPYEPAAF